MLHQPVCEAEEMVGMLYQLAIGVDVAAAKLILACFRGTRWCVQTTV
jgi:hypothetical protein